MPAGFTARKFNGDDQYSWAVFHKEDLPRGHRGIVFWGEPQPVVSGMDRTAAQYTARALESKR